MASEAMTEAWSGIAELGKLGGAQSDGEPFSFGAQSDGEPFSFTEAAMIPMWSRHGMLGTVWCGFRCWKIVEPAY